MYNETCEKCKTTGNEYLVGGFCSSCAEKELKRLEAIENRLKGLIREQGYHCEKFDIPCKAVKSTLEQALG